MQSYQSVVVVGKAEQQSFPNAEAYNLIFLTAAILSIISVALAIVLRLIGPPKCQNQLPEEMGGIDTPITETIGDEILQWPGVTTEPNRFDGIEVLVNKKEMGHLHGERLADLPFPIEVGKELVASGRAIPHHIYPDSGWVSYLIRNSDDIPAVVNLFKMQYERLKLKSTIPYAG